MALSSAPLSSGQRFRPTKKVMSRSRTLSVAIGLVVLSAAACQSTPPSSSPNAGQLFTQAFKAQGAGKLSTARADYTKALAEDPTNRYKDNKYDYFNLGVLDQSAGNTAAAATEYRKALLVDPDYTSALYNLAIVDTPSSPQNAILLYEQILAITPKDPNTLYNLGLLLYDTGQIAQGQTMLKEAIFLAPSLQAKLPASVTL
jgi:tetratricopeptide (TPR) repeat protein